jgi:hypothetical protein
VMMVSTWTRYCYIYWCLDSPSSLASLELAASPFALRSPSLFPRCLLGTMGAAIVFAAFVLGSMNGGGVRRYTTDSVLCSKA